MFSFRRLALALALVFSAVQVTLAQDSSSSSAATATPTQEQPAASPNQGSQSVQARIRARREQRRVQAIREVYTHLYDGYTGMGYLRFKPGPNLQRVTFYSWDTGFTRYYSPRLGASFDARGYYGTSFVGLNFSTITRPAISTYVLSGGPTYRFYMQPKYSVSGRVMAGYALGNFSGDTNHVGGQRLGLYPDGGSVAASASVIGEYNVSPGIALRLAPEYVLTNFGSSTQNSLGFTGGFVFRFGKQ